MSTQSHYRRLAENCMKMAARCTDPAIANALRILAADYLSSAEAIERPWDSSNSRFSPRNRKRTTSKPPQLAASHLRCLADHRLAPVASGYGPNRRAPPPRGQWPTPSAPKPPTLSFSKRGALLAARPYPQSLRSR